MLDALMTAALGAEVVRPPFLAWLDIDGDPVRVTTWERSLNITGTGDPDIDGHDFVAISPTLGEVSGVKRQTGGSETVTAKLSGIVGPDSDLLDVLGNEALWKGRTARLWFILLDEQRQRIGGIAPYYTGRMVGLQIGGTAKEQWAKVAIETYLAVFSAAPGRTYLGQADFDSGDTSASLTLACANGATSASSAAAATAATAKLDGLESFY